MTESESLFAVDYHGRAWVLSTGNYSNSSSWNLLPNSTKINIKRLVSFSNILYGIASDHQIYVYVTKQDIPIRIREEIYENQRWNPLNGFGAHLLPTDRAPYSDVTGTVPKNMQMLLPSDAWEWEGDDWQIENIFENEMIAEGWTYAVDFPAHYHKEKTFKSFVRRRKLFRYRQFKGANRWVKIESLHEDHTQEPFIDIAVSGLNPISSPEICCLWAVSILGKIYFRCDTQISNPEGSEWLRVPIKKGLEACQITVAKNSGTPFIVTWTGSFMFRIGVTPLLKQGTEWIEGQGPPGGNLVQLAAGNNCLWAVTRDKRCWALKGNLSGMKAEQNFEWIEIPGKVKSIVVGKLDEVVLALSDDEVSSLFLRVGISEEQRYGTCWTKIFQDVSWDSVSFVSSSGDDNIDGGSDGTSTESLVSLKPDIPQPVNYVMTGVSSNTAPNSFSCVDGGCLSYLKVGVDSDLEVGPWRENILSDLQKLKIEQGNFRYENALESGNISWSKSARIKFLHPNKTTWLDGQLEMNNNNYLMFHENLEKTWLCSVNDVLSVFTGIAGPNTLTCRIRNALEPGVAEFVNFKFSSTTDSTEWLHIVSELATRSFEDFCIANIWLTTRDGEIHNGGQIRVLDAPVEAEVVHTSSQSEDEDFKLHHPLVRGFMADSHLIVDFSLPRKPQRFSINLKGRTDVNAFHFNPRFKDAKVVRNSFSDGEWGDEETDGVFPFREDNMCSYSANILCTQTHIITTITEKKFEKSPAKRSFIFQFKHRVPPKCICNLYIYGDINVSSVRYDPKFGEDNYELEFATNTIPGHFFKIEAGSNGLMAWALGYDLKVWCYTGSLKNQKTETLGVITDEQIYYTYENERWNPITGFGSHGLPTDRHGFSDETGRIRLEKDEIKLFGNWNWGTEWEIDYENADKSGWQYAVDFPASYHSHKNLSDFVRRRRWKRVALLSIIGPWQNAGGVKLVDLSIRMNENCDWEVLGLTEDGDAVVRQGITPECPVGKAWESIPTSKPMVSISGWFGQRIWTVGKDGFAYIRYGNSYQILDRPRETPLKMVKVGSGVVWALGTNKALYRRSETKAAFPEGREWVKVTDSVSQIGVAPDGTLWALLKTGDMYGCTLARRMGISQNNPGGLGWEKLALGPWRHFSVAGCFSRNK